MLMVDPKLLDLVQQSWEICRKELAAFRETITALQDQQHSLESKVEEHQRRLDEQAMQIDSLAQLQDRNYNRMLEMFERLREQLRQGMLQVFLLCM